MLLLCVLQDALCTEHVSVLHTVKLDFLRGVRLAELDLAFSHCAAGEGWVGCGGHRQPCEHLVVDWQVVWADLVR